VLLGFWHKLPYYSNYSYSSHDLAYAITKTAGVIVVGVHLIKCAAAIAVTETASTDAGGWLARIASSSLDGAAAAFAGALASCLCFCVCWHAMYG
jgi:hypothetical protein